jgi:hypothetical protein
MQISEILELEDGELIPSLDKCTVTKVNPVNKEKEWQFITVSDGGKDLTLIMKSKDYYLEESEVGSRIRIVAGPPVKKIPQGLEVNIKDGKYRLRVTEDAGEMETFQTKDFVHVESHDPPPDLSPTQSTEKPRPVEQIKVEHNGDHAVIDLPEIKIGPSDDVIREYTRERMHVFSVVLQEVYDLGMSTVFPMDKLAELSTSIHISLEKDNRSILAKKPKNSANKFEKPAQDNNPKPTTKSPVDEPDEEPAPPKKKPQSTDPILDYVKSQKGEPHYKQEDASGVQIGVVFSDPDKRAAALHYMFSTPPNLLKKEISRKVWNAIESFFSHAPALIQQEFGFEAMRWDQSKIESRPYEENNQLIFDDAINKIVNRKDDELLTGKPAEIDWIKVVKTYFSVDKDDRVA